MPIPTDTYWNVKRLNWVFAISGVLLVGITFWTIVQDHFKTWRQPQRDARTWDAAMVEQRIERESTDQMQARLAALDRQIADYERTIGEGSEQTRQLNQQIRDLESRKSTAEFALGLDRSVLGVSETHLQEAVVANETERAAELRQKVDALRTTVGEQTEQIAAINAELTQKKDELGERTAALDALEKERTQLAFDVEGLRTKLVSLRPQDQPGVTGLLGRFSSEVRAAPLLQFINPAEKVQQVVLTDIQTDLGGFKQVDTIDRCMTCHVNIGKPEFSEENVVAFLEEQVASANRYNLPAEWSGRSADPVATLAEPGPVALAAFWHRWARELAPAAIERNKNRLGTVGRAVGSGVTISIDGEQLAEFAYDPAEADEIDAARQEAVLMRLLEAMYSYAPTGDAQPFVSESPAGEAPHVRVEITPDADARTLDTARRNAMRYAEELASQIRETIEPAKWAQLMDRYRYALVEAVNGARDDRGLSSLDPSPVLLAHPDLDLYVSVDSPHSFEQVGCTSCHDGSGMETDFVLAAHVARPIWVDDETGEPVLPAQLRPTRPIAPEHREDLSSMLAALYPEGAAVPAHADALHLDFSHAHDTAHGADAHDDAGHAEDQPSGPVASADTVVPDAAPAPAPAAAATVAAADDAPSDTHASHAGPAIHVPDAAPEDAAPVPYVDPVTGETGRAVSQMRHWRETYEPAAPRSFALVYHEWDRPMLSTKYLQANCVRCHTESYDIADFAPVVHRGRHLFKAMGCANCHQMDSLSAEAPPAGATEAEAGLVMSYGQRKVGTDLRHVTSKLSQEMINTWVWAPKAFRPSTRMPHFFMLENNSSDEEIRRTKQEARAITEYLVQTATPLPPKHPVPQGVQGNPQAGRELFNSIGCLACHTNLGDTDPASGKTVAEQWIVTDLVQSGRLAREMEQATGEVQEDEALAAEAQRRYEAMSYNERQLYVAENLAVEGPIDERPTYPGGDPKPMFVQHGPELSGIGTKLLAGRSESDAVQWLYDWLMEPQHYSAYTVMPDLRLTEQQAMDMAAYLLAQRRTNIDPDDAWQAGLTSPDSGKLIELTSFFLRTRFSHAMARQKADDDAELLALATDALTTSHVTADEAAARAAGMGKDQQRMVFLGKRLVSHYGCMSCHAINGTEALSSPCADLSMWGQKSLSQIDFAFLDHHKHVPGPHQLPETTQFPLVNGVSAEASHLISTDTAGAATVARPVEVAWPHLAHTRTDWITQKLKNSRIFDRGKMLLEPKGDGDDPGRPYDKLKMPTFYLNDEEVDAIVTFVISNRERLISERLHNQTVDDEAEQIARGRMLAAKFNCIGCHQVEQNVPPVQQYYGREDLTTKAPPSLRGEGNKIQHDWLFNFLKNVEVLRPLPVIRMPSFPISDGDASALAAYFHAVSEKESRELRELLDPVVEYVDTRMGASEDPLYSESPWPGDDWYTRPEFAKAADRLVRWGLSNGQIVPLQIDPTRNSPEELAVSYRDLLFRARFTAGLYDSPYPFTDSPRPQLTDERFRRGESLFYEMQCLKCHIMGDPSAPGAAQAPTAPNLSHTHRRLQRRWVRHWVQEPPIIQTGTAMPPFLTGRAIFNQEGLTWPRSQGVTGEEAARVESLYGTTPDEQADLVLDFLYAAGVNGYTAVQPQQTGALPGVEPIYEPSAPTTQPVHPQYAKVMVEGAAPAPVEPEVTEEPVAAEAAPPVVAGAPVSGKIVLDGAAPEPNLIDMSGVPECAALHADVVPDPSLTVGEGGALQDVIVWIDGVEGSFPTNTAPAVLDQQGCMYVPHVLAMQVGQPLVVKNSDPFLHNVHSLAQENPAFNFGQPNVDPGREIGTMKVPELFRVKCDVHPWMSSYIRVFEHPFFATTKADGTFTIPNVPPGTYTLRLWHEQLGTREQQVTVEAGTGAANVQVSYPAAAAAHAAPADLAPSLGLPPMRDLVLGMIGQTLESGAPTEIASQTAGACPSCAAALAGGQ